MKDDETAAEFRRLVLTNEAIFEAANEWLASPECPNPRPLSLASLEALRIMRIPFESIDYDSREIALFRWLHVQPLREVRSALWHGTWPLVFVAETKLADEVIAQFRSDQKRVRDMIAAATVNVRPKPRKGNDHDDTPLDVIKPTVAWHRIAIIARAANMTPMAVAWEMAIGQALALYHDALWSEGCWTVRPGVAVEPEELNDLMPEVLK